MLFNSWTFVLFLIIVTTIYYRSGRSQRGSAVQAAILFISSLYFYSYQNPLLTLLLILSISMNIILCKLICNESLSNKLPVLATGVVLNLLLLCYFKYAALLISLLIPVSHQTELPDYVLSIPLPIGISFYTFQAISLLVDLSRSRYNKNEPVRKLFETKSNIEQVIYIGFYISFFPQLIAGPIVVANYFISQISEKRFSDICWDRVATCLITGFFLKMVVADNIKDVTALLTGDYIVSLGKFDLIFLLYGYSFQIFADFAGYSLIAIGLGSLLGYKFPTNFNFPYLSQSITEFWRRWHISLSSFLRDYLYKPLGGNQLGTSRTYFNLMIVMVIGGLWHGAAWSYAIWGGAHGVILALERSFKTYNKRKFTSQAHSPTTETKSTWALTKKIFRISLTFNIVSMLWLLFIMPDISDVALYFRQLQNTSVLVTNFQTIYIVLIFSLPIIIYHFDALIVENYPTGFYARFARQKLKLPILAAMLFLIIVNSGTSGSFIYFQF